MTDAVRRIVECPGCGRLHEVGLGRPVRCGCGTEVRPPEPPPAPEPPPEPAPEPPPPAAEPPAPEPVPAPGGAPAAPATAPPVPVRPKRRKATSRLERVRGLTTVVERAKPREVAAGVMKCRNCKTTYDTEQFGRVDSCKACGAKGLDFIARAPEPDLEELPEDADALDTIDATESGEAAEAPLAPDAARQVGGEDIPEAPSDLGAPALPPPPAPAAAAGPKAPERAPRPVARTWEEIQADPDGEAIAIAADPFLGRRVGGAELTSVIGRGAMGQVYRAVHPDHDFAVAVKVLPPALAGDDEKVKRFVREAAAARRIDHPNVVRYLDVGADGDVYFILMEFVEGRSVGDLIREERAVKIEESLRIIEEAARGLGAAHALNIVHRDIKPDNILIAPNGHIKVADFGLAHDMDASASFSQTGEIVGTPYYISPEQIDCLEVDGRADLYSLGATIYHLITGKRPFEGASPMEVLLKHVNERLVPPVERNPLIPPDVSRCIEKMMQKDREWRYESVDALLADIEAIARGEHPTIELEPEDRPLPTAGGSVRLPRRRPVPLWIWVLAIVAVGVLVGHQLVPALDQAPFATRPPDPVSVRAAQRLGEARGLAAGDLDRAGPALAALDAVAARFKGTDAAADAAAEADALRGRLRAAVAAAVTAARGAAADDPRALGRALVALGTLADRLGALPEAAPLAAVAAERRAALAATGWVLVRGGEGVAPFLLGRDEVTVARYAARADAEATLQPPDWSAQRASPDRPVRSVTGRQAAAFARAEGARLPTAAEWERAAAGPADARPRAAPIAAAHAGAAAPVPVDAPTADVSPEGARHLGGNVAEWTADVRGGAQIVKGGAWFSRPANTAPAAALALAPDAAHPGLGFRLARDLD